MTDWRMPWPEPISHYDSGAPMDRTVVFALDGRTFSVSPTKYEGCDTGRMRFRVECLTCGCVMHDRTTCPAGYIESHLKDGSTGYSREPKRPCNQSLESLRLLAEGKHDEWAASVKRDTKALDMGED